jgi:hypothetical protein
VELDEEDMKKIASLETAGFVNTDPEAIFGVPLFD